MDQFERVAHNRALAALQLIESAPRGIKPAPELSFSRMVLAGATNRPFHHDDAMILDAARDHQLRIDPDRVGLSEKYLPWDLLASRAMNTSSGAAGGFAVGVDTLDPVDILRPFSVAAQMGISSISGLAANAILPRTSAKTSPAWLTEGGSVSPGDPTLGSISLTPKTAGAIITVSRQLLEQSPALADAYIARELSKSLATAVDQAVISGSGGVQPLGLLSTTGVQSQSGTTLGLSGLSTMLQLAAEANAADDQIRFLTTPAVRRLLQSREVIATSGVMTWRNGQVADKPGFVTTDCPTATLIAGDWSDVLLGFFGAGVEIAFQHANFNAATISFRALVRLDVAVRHPASWVVASSIT